MQFCAVTGTTPAKHRRQLRLQEACRLLRETDDTVTTVAKTLQLPETRRTGGK